MRVTYIGPLDRVTVHDQDVSPGETVDLPADIARSLLEQTDAWAPATKTKNTPEEA